MRITEGEASNMLYDFGVHNIKIWSSETCAHE